MAETADSQTLLCDRVCEAIDNNDIENVRMCIDKTCYSQRYHEHMCPLALACCRGHEEVMEELLKAGADPNHVSVWCRRPAMFIAAQKRVLTLSMMRCLISHGAGVDFRNLSGENILHYLPRGQFSDTRDNLLSAVKLVLENGASVDARDKLDHTPLYWACRSGKLDLVKLFIAEGADVNFNTGHVSMLRMAADSCDINMFDVFLNAGANRHLIPNVLIKPCKQNNHAMIEKILDACDVDINMPLGLNHSVSMTILHYACIFPEITSETVRLLLDRGADVRTVTDTRDTALHYAVMHCDCKKIRHLLSYNPPLNINNNLNQTPLLQLTQHLIFYYPQSRELARTQDQRLADALYQANLLAFKMLVTAGAKITTDIEHMSNELRHKHPDAQLPDYEIRSTRSLKEMCRFVIRGTISVPVDVSRCKLPIPKLLQEYLDFPEFDLLTDNFFMEMDIDNHRYSITTTTTTTTSVTTNTTTTTTDATTTTTTTTTAVADDDDNETSRKGKNNNEKTAISKTTKVKGRKTKCVLC